ncbi:HGxxPAAW family protein [Xylanimonas ulmi]|nr:HGxxPAAW family protein [Xylanibacterium ulmi]
MAENTNAENLYLPDAAPFHNEGKTVAAWVAMIGVTLGAIIASAGFLAPTTWVIVAGAVVIVASLVAGAVLRAMGHGQPLATSREPRA